MIYRVLLTGAAGFIGSHVARLLVSEGHHVTAILRPATDRRRIREIEGRLTILEGDLGTLDALASSIRAARPEICIHLAWQELYGKASGAANISSLTAGLELLRVTSAAGCDRFVTAGTCFEYDLGHDRLAETTPLRPHDLYGACKKALFEVGREFSAVAGISVVVPRVFYAYGPYQDAGRLVPSIALSLLRGERAALTPGKQIRDYLHVEDIASAIWAVTISGRTGAVNIASGEPVTIADVAQRIGQLLGRPDLIQLGALEYPPNEPMRIVGDPSLLRCGVGWTPRFDLETGLARTVAWWRDWETRA